jgi:cysteine-rich repeat protein
MLEGIGPNVPCPEGTSLCSDGTCSIECRYTDEDYSSCNYDGVCDTGTEGCTCSDCNLEQDSCESGTLCSADDSYCCNPQSDGICEPYCGSSDPDCGSTGKVCGNGYKEIGEECDDGNTVSGDGCSSTCTYEIIGPGELCPEGTAMCSDGTCSVNCFSTDEGYSADPSGDCASGLIYSQIDNACCRTNNNAICNPYCSYTDPDCGIDTPSVTTGSCKYTDNSNDNCEDGILERDLTATWTGEGEKPASCKDVTDKLVCPAQIKVSFFGALQFAIAVILIVLIYFIIKSRIKKEKKIKHVKRKSSKRTSKKKKSRKN